MPTPLPIDPFLPRLLDALRSSGAIVLQAEPGAGKTTRVPPAMLDAGLCGQGEVLVLQPRRLAARLAARRVADERGERLGETVGYQVRFEEVAGPSTRLRFVTEGILTRRLLADPTLARVGAVVLDEFHERHLDGDLALALLKRLRSERRPELKLVVMSATLDAKPVADYLGGPAFEIPGRRFEVAIEHLDQPDPRPLEQQVTSAVRRLCAGGGPDGDVLAFLPGAAEIRRAREALEPLAEHLGIALTALHGDLSAQEQDRALAPAGRPKVILSTNVAETSVTLEGVVAVVDSGLARIAGHSAWSGMPTLKVGRVSKASTIQRAGRAGRLRPGRCLRLYTRHDFETRPALEAPEVKRLDLAQAALALHGAGAKDLAAFPWFEAPPVASLEAADRLLTRLGALSASGELTELGRRMLRFPLHPRQSRVLLEAEARGRGVDGCILAALLGEREIRLEARGGGLAGGAPQARVSGPSDLLESMESFREASRSGFSAAALRSLGLDGGAARAVDRVRKSLERQVQRGAGAGAVPDPDPDRPLLLAALAGYPDRVARRREPNGAELVLCGGGTARLAPSSVVRDARFLIAVDAEERPSGALVRVASRVEPEWLLDLFSESMREVAELSWNEAAERAEGFSRLFYENLVLEETRATHVDPEAASALLFERALAKGPAAFAPPEALDELLARVRFAADAAPEQKFPTLAPTELEAPLRSLCAGKRSFAELREGDLLEAVKGSLSGAQRAALERLAPERVELAGGRRLRVRYEAGKPPWVESRLQDFFGSSKGPAAAGGRVPLVLHLLAPSGRPVQVTTDLAGFWDRHYPSLRRELSRKYPRHSWPEDPRTAAPPAPGPRRAGR
jgi:ATP-dependent helicase HrpB